MCSSDLVEQELTSKTLFTLGYVGSAGQHLQIIYDLNQPAASGTATANTKPYAGYYNGGPNGPFLNEGSQFATQALLGINQLNFEAASNYNSFQATLKQGVWKGLQGTIYYTWSKALDDASSSTTPMNSYNAHLDYGPSTFDNRHLISAFVYYDVPQLGHSMPKITKGWQLNSIYSFSTGTPISPAYSTNIDGTGELKDRPNYNGISPYVGGTQLATTSSSARTYRFLTATPANSFTAPASGTYGNEMRDNFFGPDFRTVDFSMFKHTPITERVMSELRVEIFNIFNFQNFANPTTTPTSSSFGLITQTRNGSGAPGIGNGEPFNIQFALKLTF